MWKMFVMMKRYGDQMGDFLEECIKDKNMKAEGCKIERGKYCPTITFVSHCCSSTKCNQNEVC